MIKYLSILLFFIFDTVVAQQSKTVQINMVPLFENEQIVLDSMYQLNEEELNISVLKFYLSNFTFLNNQVTVFSPPNSFHLIDLEDSTSLLLALEIPDSIQYNELSFNLGIDSLTNVSGVMGGDLDPMKGMYWSWNTGYINFKLEGSSPLCESRGNSYQYHLGGYLTPFSNVQAISFLLDNDTSNITLNLELADFFKQINLSTEHTIMSPSSEAVLLSKLLADSFSLKKSD